MQLFLSGVWEQENFWHLRLIKEHFPESIFIDIGAHMGLFSLAAAALGMQVIAFEPVSKSYKKFCRSIA